MDLESYRTQRGVTLEQAAEQVGLSSKGYLSRLEKGREAWPIRLALQVERWSDGHVRAVDLLEPDDAALLRGCINRAMEGAVSA